MELFTPGHLVPLLIIAGILFFGWKQLPDMARSAGKSLRVFRSEVKGLTDEDASRATREAINSVADTPPAAPSPTSAPPVSVEPSAPQVIPTPIPDTSSKPTG